MRRESFGVLVAACAALALAVSTGGCAGPKDTYDVSTGNIDELGLAWSLDLPGEVTLEATPLAVDGTLFFTGSYAAVYAVDGATGKLLWKYDPETWKHNPAKMHMSFGANRGAAYENG